MNRRALLSASALTLTGLAGCTGTVREQVSGGIDMELATTIYHPADEPWFVGGLSAQSSNAYRTELFTQPPPDDADLFTGHYPHKEHSLDNDIRNDDYSTGFLLLFEAKMPRRKPYSISPTILHGDLSWSAWDTASIPMRRDSRDPESLSFGDDVDEVISTTLVRYEADATPSKAVVTVYDEETGGQITQRTARSRFQS
ncbi:hypothetical protein [Halogeometricum borinquense]|uniref:hypothetical protein n=1 Tax=Halogeometricum borinquense TaxID=60847 RepID=UPI003436887D